MTEESNALPAGFSLHRYLIDSILGAGGFGITYRAIHEALENQVALKEYFPAEWAYRDHDAITVRANAQGQIPARSGEPACYDWGLQRFLDEAKILVQINHPCVVRVRDYFTANGSAYIVMEYEAGESLSALLQRGGILPENELRHLLDDVMPALEAVHGQGYLHRDLKPSNLYIRSADGRVMLIDFGAARQALGRRTRSVTSVVTPGYSPIEQYVTVGDDYGPWTDIYALGAVLYRCITGAPPIEAPGRVLKDPVQPAVECGAGLYSRSLLRVVDKALAVRPEERFQTVAAMREALRGGDQPNNRADFLQVPQLRPELLDLPAPNAAPSLNDALPRSRPSLIVLEDDPPWDDRRPDQAGSQLWRFEKPGLPGSSATSSNQSTETLSVADEKSSGWTLADFDTQNPASAPVAVAAPDSSPPANGSASLPWSETRWEQPDQAVSQVRPPAWEEPRPASVPSGPQPEVSGATLLNRPPHSAVEHLRQATLYKGGGSPSTGLVRPESSAPFSQPINRREGLEQPQSQPKTIAPIEPEGDAIAYGPTRQVNWKWILIMVCVIAGLSGGGLLGYEYFKTVQEEQRREAVKKQQAEEEIAQRAQEDAQRREADIADRTQKFRSSLASHNLIAAELNLERLAEAYPDHPVLATLRSELKAAEQQGATAKTWLDEKTGIKLAFVQGGCFNMGSPPSEQDRASDESAHQICVKNFWISTTETTNRQYHRFKPEHSSGSFQGRPLDRDAQPVVNVTWENAKAFTEWLSWEAGTGKRFRLPTEAEWEYAARSGTTTRYYWGNEIDPRYANFSDRNDPSGASVKSLDDGQAVTAPVGSYLPNRFGISDMAGNVWEWTCAEYDRAYSGQELGCSDKSATDGLRVVRGGSWNNGPGDLRSAKRFARKPDQRDAMTGFRVVMEE